MVIRTPEDELVVPPDVIDGTWMTEVLERAGLLTSARVVDVGREPCGTGQLADSYRFTLTYDLPGAGPETVVGKFPSSDATSRTYGGQTGYYRNEINFYREISPSLSVSSPTPIYAAMDENETDFVLLMQDLAPARVVDQLVGCDVNEAALAVEQAAALHAGSWQRHDLADKAWLGSILTQFQRITDVFPATTEAFPETFGDLVGETDLAEANKLNTRLDAWRGLIGAPTCLWHTDFRADNMLFDTQGGTSPIAILDWQGVTYGRGTIDVAYFLGTSLTIEQRRQHEQELLRHYHAALVSRGVSGYPFETCWNDYRMDAIHTLQIGVFGAGAVKRTPRGDEMWRVWIERAAAHTRDLDSFTALDRR